MVACCSPFSSLSGEVEKMYYKPGDSITMGGYHTAGFVTKSLKSVLFVIPLSKPVKNSSVITLNNAKLVLRQNGGYANPNSTAGDFPDSIQVNLVNEGTIRIVANFNVALAGTNNDAIGVQIADESTSKKAAISFL